MVEIFTLLLVIVALMMVVPMAFPGKKAGGNSIAAMKAEMKKHATGSSSATSTPDLHPKRTTKRTDSGRPWRELAVVLVTILQAGIGIGVLYFAYEIYQTTPTANGLGGLSSLSFYAQFWLGVMFIAAAVAFSTGIFTHLKHYRYALISGSLQILMGGLFLMLGNWALPIAASLIVFALCSILIVREVRLASALPRTQTTPMVSGQVGGRA